MRTKVGGMNMPTILVTGGAGYIGSHTAKRLLEADYHVVVLDNMRTGHRWAIERLRRLAEQGSSQFVFVQGDVADTALVVRLVHEYGVEAAVHFAALSLVGESMQHPERYFAENVAKGIALFNALVVAGVRYVVFSSTAAVYGIPERVPIAEDTPTHPLNPYGASKRMLEEALRWLGEVHPFRSISLRYFNAAGADPDGWLGEAHDPETHLIPLAIRSVLCPDEDRVAQLLGYSPTQDQPLTGRRFASLERTIPPLTALAFATTSTFPIWPRPMWWPWKRCWTVIPRIAGTWAPERDTACDR